MQNVIIHTATFHDIPAMADLWYEKMVLHGQTDSRVRLLADGRERWSAAVAGWLSDTCCQVYVAEREGEVVGYIIGQVRDNLPGMQPERIGAVTDMTIGAHSYQSGLGRVLLHPLEQWFCEQGIEQIVAHVPRRLPVEQAFWRALGAQEWVDVMWLRS